MILHDDGEVFGSRAHERTMNTKMVAFVDDQYQIGEHVQIGLLNEGHLTAGDLHVTKRKNRT